MNSKGGSTNENTAVKLPSLNTDHLEWEETAEQEAQCVCQVV